MYTILNWVTSCDMERSGRLAPWDCDYLLGIQQLFKKRFKVSQHFQELPSDNLLQSY